MERFKIFLLTGFALCLFSGLQPVQAQAPEKKPDVFLHFYSRWDNDKLRHLSGAQTFNDIWGWTSPEGREYAIMGSIDSIYFIEVTQPEKPVVRDVEAGRYNACVHRDFKTYSHYAYAVADEGYSSLQIFDLQYLPDSVHKVYDSDSLVVHSHNLYIDNGRLYVCARLFWTDSARTDLGRYPLSVFSLENPEKPKLMGDLHSLVTGGTLIFDYGHDVFVRNDTAYLSTGDPGLFIYNMKDPAQPKLIQSIQPPYPGNGYNHSSWLSHDGNILVFADETHYSPLKIYNVARIKDSTDKNPELYFKSTLGSHTEAGSIPHNPFIKGNYLYISYYHEGIVVFDISDPAHPVQVAQYDTYPGNNDKEGTSDWFKGYAGAWGVYPYFPSGTIVGSDMTNGLFVFRLDTFPVYQKDMNVLSVSTYLPDDHLSFSAGLNKDLPFDITLTDMLGRVVFRQSIPGQRGEQRYHVELGGQVRNGTYVLSILAGDSWQSYKVIKL